MLGVVVVVDEVFVVVVALSGGLLVVVEVLIVVSTLEPVDLVEEGVFDGDPLSRVQRPSASTIIVGNPLSSHSVPFSPFEQGATLVVTDPVTEQPFVVLNFVLQA